MTAWDFLNENARGIAALIFVAIVIWSTSRGSVKCECDCTEAIKSLGAEVTELRETIALAAIKEEIANMRSEVVALRCQMDDLSEDLKDHK